MYSTNTRETKTGGVHHWYGKVQKAWKCTLQQQCLCLFDVMSQKTKLIAFTVSTSSHHITDTLNQNVLFKQFSITLGV